jgi:hypothetical protein
MPNGLPVFLHAERIQESGNNYKAHNSVAGASGAYQFLYSTWLGALAISGLFRDPYVDGPAAAAPPWVQDAAAGALMTVYYNRYGHSWFNVAEAWYGGGGAVGHPNRGGGPGYPNVGQYAAQVISIYHELGGTNGGGTTGPVTPPMGGNEWSQALKMWDSLTHWDAVSLPDLNIDLKNAAHF